MREVESKGMRLRIRETGEQLAVQVRTAYSFGRRLRGLMLTESLPAGQGLHLHPCRSVHSFFMRYPIDVLYLNESGVIVGVQESLKPGRVGTSFLGTKSVVELPEGTLRRAAVQVGQSVIWSADITN